MDENDDLAIPPDDMPLSPAAKIDDEQWAEATPDQIDELMTELDQHLQEHWDPDQLAEQSGSDFS